MSKAIAAPSGLWPPLVLTPAACDSVEVCGWLV
jgi:hypothetical protein